MTLEEMETMPVAPLESGGFPVMDSSIPQRDRPLVHSAADPPLCETCQQTEMSFFDPNCPGCHELLLGSAITIPEIFAILRQWTPQTQQSLELLICEILKHGGHVDDRDGLTDMTMLHYACKAGSSGVGDMEEACRMVQLLISKGADVYVRCRWTHMTPLHYATYFDTAPVIRILLKATKGFDIDCPCSEFEGGTALHIAATNLAEESSRVLLQNGADPQARDDLGRSPLDCVPDPDSYEPDSDMAQLARKMRKMLSEAEPVSSLHGQPNYDSVSSKVTLQSMGLHIGDKVVVGGVKSGILRFSGPTEFAPGVWAGIELDDAVGKNDGTVGGVSYFKCPPKHGIFAPISKISRPGILANRPGIVSKSINKGPVGHGNIDTSHVTAKVDTGLSRRSSGRSSGMPDGETLSIGDRVLVAGQRRGIIRYTGETDFAPGWWYGIELDRPVGKNDGSVNNRRYFTCKPKFGVFAPPSRAQRIDDSMGEDSFDLMTTSMDERQHKLAARKKWRRIGPRGVGGSQPILCGSPGRPKSALIRPKSSGSSGSLRRSLSVSAGSEFKLQEGMSVFCNNELGTIRYIGPVEFAEGIWLGVELRTPKGKNDGSVQGNRYFTCKPNYGLIVRPSKVTVRGINGAKLLGDNGDKL